MPHDRTTTGYGERDFTAAGQSHDERRQGVAHGQPGLIVVVDDDRNMQGIGRDLGAHDLADLAGFADLELRGGQTGDRHTLVIESTDVDRSR